jgi:hypothetical protein
MNDYIQQAVLNKSRKDKFVFVLTLPEAMKDMSYKMSENRQDDRILPETLQFSVYGAVLPSVRVDAGHIRYSGQAVQFSSHSRPEYSNVNVNFTVDNRFNNYWVIWKWLDILNDDRDAIFHKNKRVSLSESMFKEYQGSASMYALDEYNKQTVRFDYQGLVPVSLGQIDYNYRDADEIETTFEFSFSKLTPILL